VIGIDLGGKKLGEFVSWRKFCNQGIVVGFLLMTYVVNFTAQKKGSGFYKAVEEEKILTPRGAE